MLKFIEPSRSLSSVNADVATFSQSKIEVWVNETLDRNHKSEEHTREDVHKETEAFKENDNSKNIRNEDENKQKTTNQGQMKTVVLFCLLIFLTGLSLSQII